MEIHDHSGSLDGQPDMLTYLTKKVKFESHKKSREHLRLLKRRETIYGVTNKPVTIEAILAEMKKLQRYNRPLK